MKYYSDKKKDSNNEVAYLHERNSFKNENNIVNKISFKFVSCFNSHSKDVMA